MSEASDLVRLLEQIRLDTQSQLTQAESGGLKLYSTGPGNASIDGTLQFLQTLRQQLDQLDQALTVAKSHLPRDE